jgi:hypothetical protein
MPRTASLLLITLLAAACQPQADATDEPTETAEAAAPAADPNSPEAKIANAMSAAPEAISANATIMDTGMDGMMMELRAGTNGWTCMPDLPQTPGPDPMCLDGAFLTWVDALIKKEPPNVSGVGLAYMLQGGSDASNSDPFATGPAPGADWVDTGPHVMMIPENPADLEGIPTDYTTGAPYVMYKGTPYAHIMMPVR